MEIRNNAFLPSSFPMIVDAGSSELALPETLLDVTDLLANHEHVSALVAEKAFQIAVIANEAEIALQVMNQYPGAAGPSASDIFLHPEHRGLLISSLYEGMNLGFKTENLYQLGVDQHDMELVQAVLHKDPAAGGESHLH